jgi:hypothetical protein
LCLGLAGIPEPGRNADFIYFIIPLKDVAKNGAEAHGRWLSEPKKSTGEPRRDNDIRTIRLPPRVSDAGWDISHYKDKWEIIQGLLK